MGQEKKDTRLVLRFVHNKETFELWEYEGKTYMLVVVDNPSFDDVPWPVKKYQKRPTDEEIKKDAENYQKLYKKARKKE